MSNGVKVRMNWLRGMYVYTIVGAGAFGLGMLTIPGVVKSLFGWQIAEPVFFGVVGSVYLAFGLLSILGLRSPVKFSPVLLLQLCYKSLWFIGVALPLVVTAQFPAYAIVLIVIFATYIVGDIIAIPFSYLFGREDGQVGLSKT